MTKVDRTSPIPLYSQVESYFRLRIVEGKIAVGDKLPPEIELAEAFGVSRMTLRQALNNLVLDGLLVRQQGKGTFVTEPPQKLTAPLYFPVSFTEQISRLGYAASSRILETSIIEQPPIIVKRYLELSEGEAVVYIRRLRMANQIPISIDTSFLPFKLCPEILDADLAGGSLFAALNRLYGLEPVKGENWLEPIIATPDIAQLLDVQQSTPLLLMYGVSRLSDNTPIEYSKGIWRGDKVRFEFKSYNGSLSLRG